MIEEGTTEEDKKVRFTKRMKDELSRTSYL
jgi:hypothetical protein